MTTAVYYILMFSRRQLSYKTQHLGAGAQKQQNFLILHVDESTKLLNNTQEAGVMTFTHFYSRTLNEAAFELEQCVVN